MAYLTVRGWCVWPAANYAIEAACASSAVGEKVQAILSAKQAGESAMRHALAARACAGRADWVECKTQKLNFWFFDSAVLCKPVDLIIESWLVDFVAQLWLSA